MARLGVFGGSFNPVHLGHLHIALLARESQGLDAVIFVPAAHPPHKTPGALAPASDRLDMLRAALEGEGSSRISEIELEPGGPRYTVETLRALGKSYPGDRLTFIMGSDSLIDLPGWKEPERILQEFGIIAVDRPGFDPGRVEERWWKGVRVVEGNPLAISSTGIRERLRAGLSVRHLVPAPVNAILEERGLYRDSGDPES